MANWLWQTGRWRNDILSYSLFHSWSTTVNNFRKKGWSLLHLCFLGKSTKDIKKCLDGNAEAKCSSTGQYPLQPLMGFVDSAQLLPEQRADVDARDENGKTLLHYARQFSHFNCVDLLTEKYADQHAKTIQNQTPLDLAIQRKSTEDTVLVPLKNSDIKPSMWVIWLTCDFFNDNKLVFIVIPPRKNNFLNYYFLFFMKKELILYWVNTRMTSNWWEKQWLSTSANTPMQRIIQKGSDQRWQRDDDKYNV